MIGLRPAGPDHRVRAELRRLQAEVIDDARRLVSADADHPWWEHVGLDPAAEAAAVLQPLITATRAALGATAPPTRAAPSVTSPAALLAYYEQLAHGNVRDGSALVDLVSDTAHASGRLDQLLEL